MASQIQIVNLIAGHLGQDEVLSFPAQGPLGDAITQFWDTARQETLRANTWHCARKRVQLTPTTTAPAFGYSNAFNLPGDFVRFVDVNVTGFGEFRDYVREGRQLLSNSTPLNLIYIYDLTDIDYWDADLAMGFSINAHPMHKNTTATLGHTCIRPYAAVTPTRLASSQYVYAASCHRLTGSIPAQIRVQHHCISNADMRITAAWLSRSSGRIQSPRCASAMYRVLSVARVRRMEMLDTKSQMPLM